MLRFLMRSGVVAGAIALAGCDLEVANPNDPIQNQVLGTPLDAEALLGRQYLRWHQGLYGSTTVLWGMTAGQAFENYSSLANNCQNQRNSIPRAVNDNSIGNGCNGEQSRVYFFHNEVNRTASTVLALLEQEGYTIGSPARDNRARAYGQFLRGLSLGYLAMMYDSSAVISPIMSDAEEDCVPDRLSGICTGALRGYNEVRDSAFAALQLAIDLATAPTTGSGGFPLPSDWVSSPTSFTSAEFVRLVRSYRARIRANIPRTPDEADDEVDWDAVIADAENGVTSDHQIRTITTAGLGNSWLQQWNSFGNWHQMTPFIIGMGDKSGSYQAWIAQPLSARGATGSFFMETPDLRFPQGATRFAQQQDFAINSCETASTPCKRYFRNRSEGDDSNLGVSWGWSNYDFARFRSWHIRGDGSARNGNLTFLTRAELDLLAAEGHYRNGDFPEAAALINKTRTAGMVDGVATGGGLPAVSDVPEDEVPGGTECVPKKPVNASSAGGATLVCGDMLEALKWEKRIETAYTHFSGWFFDSRRWGDLVEGTPLYFAVPYTDLLARGRAPSAIYSTGVNTTPGSAAGPSTYGW